MKSFREKYGPWAIVTGGARGIGKALAEEIASNGLNVIIVDILEEEAKATAASLPTESKVICADLGTKEGTQKIFTECESLDVGLLCNNHACTQIFEQGSIKKWLDTPPDELQKVLDINLSSTIDLTYHFAQKMRPKNRGGILFVSSCAAFFGSPFLAQYGATKSFISHLGESLWWELKQDGIDVTTLFPASTNTKTAKNIMTTQGIKKYPLMSPSKVAKTGLKGLGKGPIAIPGLKNKLQVFLSTRLVPRTLPINAVGKLFPKSFRVKAP